MEKRKREEGKKEKKGGENVCKFKCLTMRRIYEDVEEPLGKLLLPFC